MNEQYSKKILFNRSTLLSLKAELLKKQEEIYEKKQQPQHKIENYKPPPPKPSESDKDVKKDKKSFKDSLHAIDTEELEACKKAKAALEKKAELYEHLSDGAGNSQLAGCFLVDFKTKKQQESTARSLSPIHQEKPDGPTEDEEKIDDDSEWTEFTDCLGRTRKCLKTDLQLYKEKDRNLMGILIDGKAPEPVVMENEDEPKKNTEKPFLVQKTNDYLLSLREKWEQKERELIAKDKDVHYQDLLFDEARMHGVAYYSFSTDDTERSKQMEELIRRREETLRAQKESEEIRKKREDLLAARVAAARARQRARAGLPPEDPTENQKDFTTCLLEFLTKQKDEADTKAKEEEKKRREEEEKEKQKIREAFVREWDIGKEGVLGDKGKKFREMTQEEYVEQQRSKRLDEFAPSSTSSSSNKAKSTYSFDVTGKKVRPDEAEGRPRVNKTWAEVRPDVEPPPPPVIGDISEQNGLYFTTKKDTKLPEPHNKLASKIKFRNFVRAQEPTPIIDEMLSETSVSASRHGQSDSYCTEIAPPPTYDYYGPIPKQPRIQKPFVSDINEAYAQGSKSLESKSRDLQLSKAYDFTFD